MTSSETSKPHKGRVKILGLDPSLTSFGVSCVTAMVTDGKVTSWKARTDAWKVKAKGVHRLMLLQHKLWDEIEQCQPEHVVVEGFAYGRPNQAHDIGGLGWMLRLSMYQWDIPFTVVAPAKLKKFVTGKGNAGKDIVMLEAYKRFDIEMPTQDEIEATCLALMYLRSQYPGAIRLPKVNASVLDDIIWGVTG